MTKVAIIRCEEKSKTCPGTSCFKAIREKKGAFEKYADEIEIVGFDTCGGCALGKSDKIVKKVEALKERGAEVVHISTCTKNGCPSYNLFMEEAAKHSKVDGNTH
jgi:predicted metal-binding protein